MTSHATGYRLRFRVAGYGLQRDEGNVVTDVHTGLHTDVHTGVHTDNDGFWDATVFFFTIM